MRYTKFLLIFMLFFSLKATAHEIRPALLQIKEEAKGVFELRWKLPRREEMILAVKPVFPKWFVVEAVGNMQDAGDGVLFRFRANAARDIHQMEIGFDGIEASLVDVLVYVDLLNGEHFSLLAQPDHPVVSIPAKETLFQAAKTYLHLGLEHILGGVDHLVFVLALILLVNKARTLIFTITAFTIAHSLTLSLSALGFIGLPAPPVEACIALSILFLALELIRQSKGEETITTRKPWLISFSFGLLHGLGFASALHEIGLPQTQVPAALAFFNIGVEVGQLIFVFFIIALRKVFARYVPKIQLVRNVIAYAIGSIATFWMIERIISFWP